MRQPVFSRSLRLLTACLILVSALLGVSPLQAQTVPPSKAATLHLSQAQINEDGSYWGILDITLNKQVKTYWRTPGEAGLPPRFDWTGSINLADVSLSWPVPIRFEDGGGHSIGYENSLTLPILFKPVDPRKAITIDLTLDYAVCDTLCLPMHERLRAVFDPNKGVSQAQQIALQKALLKVPKKQPLDSADAPAVVRVISEGEMVRIDTRSETTLAISDVFVEGPDGWVFSSPLPVSPAPDGNHSFLVKVLERPQRGDSLANLTLAVTLVAANAASETVLTLDKLGRAP